jgi:hypothetical protein
LPIFEIPLEFGWNLIGSPFLFPVHINQTMIDPDSVSSFVSQVAPAAPGARNWWAMVDIGVSLPPLQPWHGYALWCENPSGYSIYLDPHYSPPAAPENGDQSWIASIALSAEEITIDNIELGIHPRSSDGPDMTDVRTITFFNKGSSLSIIGESSESFARDIRPDADLQTWELDISGDSRNSPALTWIIEGDMEPGKSLVLHDAVTGEATDMLSTSRGRIINPDQLPDGRYRVYWGDDNLVKAAIAAGSPARPVTYRLYQNHPNPFNPVTSISYDLPHPGHVTIDIYNILGQKVIRLIDNFREAGSYETIWNGADVSSGVYFYRIRSGGFSAARKMVLLK